MAAHRIIHKNSFSMNVLHLQVESKRYPFFKRPMTPILYFDYKMLYNNNSLSEKINT